MPLKFNVNTGKIVAKPVLEDEVHLLRVQQERQNEILEKIYQSISTTKTTSTRIKENSEKE